jgi:branched-chain amino acid transport system permease protein
VHQFLQAAAFGLLQGGLLALVAVGFSLVWGVMNVINLGHGALAVAGAYVAWLLNSRLGIDPFISLPIVAVCLFGVGYVMQRFVINLIVNAPIFLTLILTYGLGLLITSALQIVFSANDQQLTTNHGYALQPIEVGGIALPVGLLIAFGTAVVVTVALALMMGRTRLGQAISATGMDRGAARLMGIRVRHIYALTFAIAAALAGVAGAMWGTIGTFNPTDVPLTLTFDAFVVSVLGGLGNMYGALVGGLVLGMAQSLGGLYLHGTWVDAIGMGVLLLTLLFRPSGLIGSPYFAGRAEV